MCVGINADVRINRYRYKCSRICVHVGAAEGGAAADPVETSLLQNIRQVLQPSSGLGFRV